MTQSSLFGGETPLEQPRLGVRQTAVLELLQRLAPEALSAGEIGATLHERNGTHSDGERCQWCARDANSVLRSLKKYRLVEKRRGGGWTLLKDQEPSYDPATAPFPDGY